MIDRYLALIITWVALWGELSLANIATGMLVAFLIIYLFPTPDRVNHSIHPLGMVKFLTRFVVDIVRSSFSVAQAVLFARNHAKSSRKGQLASLKSCKN